MSNENGGMTFNIDSGGGNVQAGKNVGNEDVIEQGGVKNVDNSQNVDTGGGDIHGGVTNQVGDQQPLKDHPLFTALLEELPDEQRIEKTAQLDRIEELMSKGDPVKEDIQSAVDDLVEATPGFLGALGRVATEGALNFNATAVDLLMRVTGGREALD